MTIIIYSHYPDKTKKRLCKYYGIKHRKKENVIRLQGKDDRLRLVFKHITDANDEGVLFFGGYIYALADEIAAEYWKRRTDELFIVREYMLIERDVI